MRLCREQRLAPDSEMGTLGDLDSQKVRKRVPCNPGCASESVESSIKKKKIQMPSLCAWRFWFHRLRVGLGIPSVSCMHKLLFHRWVVSQSLWPHELPLTRLPCSPQSPGVCSNSCPLSQWRYLTISFSAAPFSSCLQSLPASGSFPMSWLFTSGGQSITV